MARRGVGNLGFRVREKPCPTRGAQLTTTARREAKTSFHTGEAVSSENGRREEETAAVGGTRWSFDALLKTTRRHGACWLTGRRALDHSQLATTKTVATGVDVRTRAWLIRGTSTTATTTKKVTDDGRFLVRRHGQTADSAKGTIAGRNSKAYGKAGVRMREKRSCTGDGDAEAWNQEDADESDEDT